MARKRGRSHGSRKRKNTAGTRKTHPSFTGTLRMTKAGNASVVGPDGVHPVARGALHGAMQGDLVQYILTKRGPAEPQAVIGAVLERKATHILGTYERLEPLGVVVPLDKRLKHDFFVLPKDTSAKKLGVHEGDIVRARILSYPTRHEAGVVTIERRLGAANELDIGVEAIIASWGLDTEFSQAVQAEVQALSDDIAKELERPERQDLRGACCFTIDPADARDFDDAVFARELEDGGFELAVHIADVSHYVRWESSLDVTARARGCSCYLVDRVIPMLPERLSNDLCSLRPHEDRLAMSVLMTLDERAKLVEARFARSVIHSDARLNYDEVDEFLDGRLEAAALGAGLVGDVSRSTDSAGSDAQGSKPADAQAVGNAIVVLDRIAQLRQSLRHERGAIDFQSQEAKVMLDAEKKPIGVRVRTKTRATSLVEEAMLLANEAVGKELADNAMVSAYRVHESPSPDSIAQLILALKELGLAQGKTADALVAGDAHAIQQTLEQVQGKPEEYLVSTMLLRSMKRAIYLPNNQGHYALGAPSYCHFTSPIRRYPDLVVHRSLKALLDNTRDSKSQRDYHKQAVQICATASEQERVADAAASASQNVKLAEFYSDKISERFSGIVSGVESYGLFVRLDDTLAEGLLPVRLLGDEWFDYDEARLTLRGEESWRTWRLGQRIAVMVTATDPIRGRIDFALAGPVPAPLLH